MGRTKIEWATKTWSPVRGCSMVSAGCENCYAMKLAHRFSKEGYPYHGLTEIGPSGPRWNGKIKLVPEKLDEPLKWKNPERIFVNSMSDLFHEDVPGSFIEEVWAIMSSAPQHTYIVLTKRPERMRSFLMNQDWERVGELVVGHSVGAAQRAVQIKSLGGSISKHILLGVSVEDQKTADERIPILLGTPGSIRCVSVEPMLGPVDLSPYLHCNVVVIPSGMFHFN